MPDYYEINVALDGRHLFVTAPRSISTESKLTRVINIIKDKFPESEGYSITVTHWISRGQHVEV